MVRRQERGNTTDGMTQSTSIPLNREMYVEDCIDGSRNLKIGDGIHLPKDLTNVCPSIKATNLIQNGDFSNDTEGWYKGNSVSSFIVENKVAAFTASGQCGSIVKYLSNININDTIYTSASVKSVPTDKPIKMLLSYKNGYSCGVEEIIQDNQFHTVSTIGTIPKELQQVSLKIMDFNTSDFSPIYVKYVSALNLTAIFKDVGNEPTVPQMEWLMSQFPDNWFDGTKTLIDFKTMVKLLIKGW